MTYQPELWYNAAEASIFNLYYEISQAVLLLLTALMKCCQNCSKRRATRNTED